MYLTKYFLPTLKETPSEAQIASHRLMLRSGMIKQACSGIYSWLPLGFKVLKKIEKIVHEEQYRAGHIPLLMPTLQPAELWKESGRYQDYGKEMLRIKDRQGRDLLYGPTNEELITDIFRTYVNSYKDLPKTLYHIQWKFRDEVRPRFGVMRGREFYMKDGYSFDLDEASAIHSYNRHMVSYLRTYERLGLKAIPMRADTGPIGGNYSHEFLVLAVTGESQVFYDSSVTDLQLGDRSFDYNNRSEIQQIVDEFTKPYARTDETHSADIFEKIRPDQRMTARAIEVGQIFYFGTKYSKAMKAEIVLPNGDKSPVEMGSHGIGVSRLVGALIEANHDEHGIIWPEAIAPFKVGIINLKQGNSEIDGVCQRLHQQFFEAGLDPLYDDREERAGAKFASMDLIGIPWQITVGPRGLQSNNVELKCRRTGDRENISVDNILDRCREVYRNKTEFGMLESEIE